MSRNGNYIYAKSGRQMTLYLTPEKFADNVEFKFNGPVQAGPIISNWEADGIGEWNEIQYQGKSFYIFELFDYKYSSVPFGTGSNVPFIEAAPTAYSRKDQDNEGDEGSPYPDWLPDSFRSGLEQAKQTGSVLRNLALLFGVLYLLGRLQAVAPRVPRLPRMPKRTSRSRKAPVKKRAAPAKARAKRTVKRRPSATRPVGAKVARNQVKARKKRAQRYSANSRPFVASSRGQTKG